jgi:hypothetical protein
MPFFDFRYHLVDVGEQVIEVAGVAAFAVALSVSGVVKTRHGHA